MGKLQDGACITIVCADSPEPAVSADEYQFTDHYPRLRRDVPWRWIAAGGLECDMLLTPHPSASGMISRALPRIVRKRDKLPRLCQREPARLDGRLAEEAAAG